MSKPLLPEIPEILERLWNPAGIFLALDFDGTLAPIADCADDAAILPEIADLLRRLAECRNLSVAILSGRSIAGLKSKIDLDCIYAGNHGLEIDGRGISFVHGCAEVLKPAIDFVYWELDSALRGVRGVSVEHKGLGITVHYRRAPADLATWIEATVRFTVSPHRSRLAVGPARKAWEIRPRVHWNKGYALQFILSQIGMAEPLLICAGDDVSDEDMFSLSAEAISIQVGGHSTTAARYHIDGPGELAVFLEGLLSAAGHLPDLLYEQVRRAGVACHRGRAAD